MRFQDKPGNLGLGDGQDETLVFAPDRSDWGHVDDGEAAFETIHKTETAEEESEKNGKPMRFPRNVKITCKQH
jgi:hypothetical protein